MTSWQIVQGDALERLRELPAESVQTCVTSPPYFGLRDYGDLGQLGLEPTPDEYVARLVEAFREVRRVLRDDGTLWLNLGDSYANNGQTGLNVNSGKSTLGPKRDGLGENNAAWERTRPPQSVPAGLKQKDLLGIPWMVAFALRADGWYLRSDIIWAKPNPMPESVTDRPTKAHEYVFLLSKGPRYFYDADTIREEHAPETVEHFERYGDRPTVAPKHNGTHYRMDTQAQVGLHPAGRNKRSVWTVATQPFPGAHFAVFPPKLIEPCIFAGSTEGDTVLDPFAGAGTTGVVASRHNRSFIGIELNPTYAEMARDRIATAERLGHRQPERGPEPVRGQLGLEL